MITSNTGEAFLKLRLKDQAAAIQVLDTDPALKDLNHVRAPLVDLEVRGLPALQYFGSVIWKDQVFEKINSGVFWVHQRWGAESCSPKRLEDFEAVLC